MLPSSSFSGAFSACFLLFLVVATVSEQSDIIGIPMGTKSSAESRANFLKLYDGTNVLFTSTQRSLDRGQQILSYMYHQQPGFKYDIGFRWTGKEILCNCTGSYCGSLKMLQYFDSVQLKKVCIGLACYQQKRLHQQQNGEIIEDEHMGCYGGEPDTHDHHDTHEPLFCADTPHVRTRCCWSSFCQKDITPFDFPFHEDLERQKLKVKNQRSISIYAVVAFGGILFMVLVIVLLVLIKSKRPKWFFEKFGKKKRESEGNGEEMVVMMMDLDGAPPPPFPPFNHAAYNMLNNESGGTSQADSAKTGAPGSSDGSHPLNHLLRDLDDSRLSHEYAEYSSGPMGNLCQKNNFLGEVERVQPPIGQGRYGTVYRAKWKGQVVAMKVLISRYEHSYFREVSMYRSGILRHTNILQFLGNDLYVDSQMEMCMVFEYHANGSLDSYLSNNTVDVTTAIRMMYSMVSGLAFLHCPMETSNASKPAIAHRDFKSGNVLVKGNLMTCISDLGLAVCYVDGKIGIPKPSKSDHFEIENKPADEKIEMCGTMRYLSPELLANDFDWSVFESYKSADIYSMALVMYEICRRVKVPDREEYPYTEAMPFFRQITENGGCAGEVDWELMKKIVVEDGERPDRTSWWTEHEVLGEIDRIMCESWATDPQVRLTAPVVIRSLEKLAKKVGISLEQT